MPSRERDRAAVRTSTTFSVDEVAQRYAVSKGTVITWVRNGELKAVNISRSRNSKKPRYRITQAAIDAFEAARMPTPPAPRTSRRRSQSSDVVEFYT